MGTSGTRLRFFAPGRFMCGFSCRPPALVSQSALAVVRKGYVLGLQYHLDYSSYAGIIMLGVLVGQSYTMMLLL